MRDLIEPVGTAAAVDHRSATSDSIFAEKLVATFWNSGAAAARVRVSDTPYTVAKLYELCRRVCRKRDFAGRVKTCKRGDRIILVRLMPTRRA